MNVEGCDHITGEIFDILLKKQGDNVVVSGTSTTEDEPNVANEQIGLRHGTSSTWHENPLPYHDVIVLTSVIAKHRKIITRPPVKVLSLGHVNAS